MTMWPLPAAWARAEQLRTMLPLCERKTASPICGALAEAGEGSSRFQALGWEEVWGDGLAPIELPLDRPRPSDRTHPHLLRAEDKSWQLPETCEEALTAQRSGNRQ